MRYRAGKDTPAFVSIKSSCILSHLLNNALFESKKKKRNAVLNELLPNVSYSKFDKELACDRKEEFLKLKTDTTMDF